MFWFETGKRTFLNLIFSFKTYWKDIKIMYLDLNP